MGSVVIAIRMRVACVERAKTNTMAAVILELRAWHGSMRQYVLIVSLRNFRMISHLSYFTESVWTG
jgi:hypothetical protein